MDDDATSPPPIVFILIKMNCYLREVITAIIHMFGTFRLDVNLVEHRQLIVNYRVLMSNYCYDSVL